MEFEKLIADFSEAAGFGLETDSQGTVWCEADGVLVTVQHRSESGDAVIFTFPFGEMPTDEPMMRHALELSVAGIGTGGFFLGLHEDIFTLSGTIPLDDLDAETLARRMLDLAAATRRVALSVGSSVVDECAGQVDAEEHSSDVCNQFSIRV
ncbi:MAG: CesT family type III secretion system chaperone [Kiritimatiellae bacterium]|nr:CesT family type III secretion system chaperone [Kiritimatiellia bacterium]